MEKKIKTYINGILAHENIGIDTKIINLYQLGPEWWHIVWIWWGFGAYKGYQLVTVETCHFSQVLAKIFFHNYTFPRPDTLRNHKK